MFNITISLAHLFIRFFTFCFYLQHVSFFLAPFMGTLLKKFSNQLCLSIVKPKKISLVSGNRSDKFFLITHPPAICIRIYIFKFKNNKQRTTKKQESKKAEESNEEKRLSLENRLKINKSTDARVKIFLVTRIFRNKSIIFFWPY